MIAFISFFKETPWIHLSKARILLLLLPVIVYIFQKKYGNTDYIIQMFFNFIEDVFLYSNVHLIR